MHQIIDKIKNRSFCPPDIIIVYGPPASGKGTQSNLLCKNLESFSYHHLDFGHMLREYVQSHLGKLKHITQEHIANLESSDSTTDDVKTAIKTYKTMKKGMPVEPDIIWRVVEDNVKCIIEKKERIIIDGLGRTIEDCYRFSKIVNEYKLKVAIFHLCLTEDEVIQRSVNRWYAPHCKLSFPSYLAAKAVIKDDHEEPWQRSEDTNVTKIRDRYRNIYEHVYAKALSTLQTECLAKLFIIDGSDSMDETFGRIIYYLDTFYSDNTI